VVKTNLDFTEARDSEWQWHQLGHMQVCTLLQTDNHTTTPPLISFLQVPSCRPTNSVKALTDGSENETTTKKFTKSQRMVSEIYVQTDRHTDGHAAMLITMTVNKLL